VYRSVPQTHLFQMQSNAVKMILVVLTGTRSNFWAQLAVARTARPRRRETPQVQRQPRLTHEQRVELVAQYEAGVPTLELARRFGLHRTSVSVILQEAGVLRPRQVLTGEQVELAVQLRAQGRFYRQIAERFGVDTETVRRAVIKWRSAT
jgi:hypothetical protein